MALSPAKTLRHGRFEGRGGAAIDERRGVMDEQPRGVDRDRHVGQHELDALEGGDRLTELLALLRVGHRGVECAWPIPTASAPTAGREPSRTLSAIL